MTGKIIQSEGERNREFEAGAKYTLMPIKNLASNVEIGKRIE